ncbi:MAG: GGDEF domain-containing protein [Pseudomonadota bacterium]
MTPTPTPLDLIHPDLRPGRYAVCIYVLCLSVLAGMALAIFSLSDRMLAEQERVANIVTQTSRLSVLVQRAAADLDTYAAQPSIATQDQALQTIKSLGDQHQLIIISTANNHDYDAAATRALDEIYFTATDPLQPKLAKFILQIDMMVRVPPARIALQTDQIRALKAQAHRQILANLDQAINTYENKLQSRMITLQIWQRWALLVILVVILLETLFVFIPLTRKMNAYTEALRQMALSDSLTSIGNRRYFEARGVEEIQRARRHLQPLSLCLMDLDHFKLVNDTYGHSVGDGVLRDIIHIINDALRAEDILARTGGEEFAILLPHADLRSASIVAERVRQAVRNATFLTERGEHVLVTLSIGVASVDFDSDTIDQAMEEADAAMYDAKFRGRNQTVVNENGQFISVESDIWQSRLKA